MSVASLRFVIDYSPLPDFYRRHISKNICFLFTSQQSSSFPILVEVTLNGLCSIFYWAVSFPAKICLCLSATRKNSLQNFVDQSLWLDSRLWSRAAITCAGHTTRWRQSCVYTLITHSSRPIKARVLHSSLYKSKSHWPIHRPWCFIHSHWSAISTHCSIVR